jgi:hypothetical protein
MPVSPNTTPTEENLRTFGEWLRRYGRPLAHYADKNSIFRTSAAAQLREQLRGETARSHFGRALGELGIEWIAAHSPQAKGRIERLFETLQDRLVKEMRLAGKLRQSGTPHGRVNSRISTAECTGRHLSPWAE